MSGPISHKARIFVVVVALLGLGVGVVYFMWPNDEAEQSAATNEAQTTMLTAKQEAVEAGSPATARSIFSRGLAAEQRGDRLRAEGQQSAAADAFRRAAHHYRRALVVADSLAAVARADDSSNTDSSPVTQAELARARQAADSLREEMLRRMRSAETAEAGELAGELYEDALSTAEDARDAYQRNTYEGYTAARDGFVRARELFHTAEELSTNRHAAMTRRKAVEQLRDQVQRTPPFPEVSQLIQQAESLRVEAHEQYEREDFSDAAHLLEDVGRMYTRIKSRIDSLRDARAEAAEQAENRAAADRARRLMQAVKADISGAREQYSLYQQARGVEREAQRLYARQSFARAAQRFQTAAEQFREVSEMPPLPLDHARDLVHELVGRYQQAVEEKNVYQLQKLVPGLDSRWWSDFFETAQNLMVSIDTGGLERTRNGATVSIRVRIDYMDEKNRMAHESFRNVWTLKPDDGDWMISSASVH